MDDPASQARPICQMVFWSAVPADQMIKLCSAMPTVAPSHIKQLATQAKGQAKCKSCYDQAIEVHADGLVEYSVVPAQCAASL